MWGWVSSNHIHVGRSVLQWDCVAIFSEEKYKAVAGYSARQWLQKRRHSRWNVFTYGSVKVCSGREKWPFNVKFIFLRVEPLCEQTWWDSPVFFFKCQLFIICFACEKHFGWTCGAIFKYPNFDCFYLKSTVFGIFWGQRFQQGKKPKKKHEKKKKQLWTLFAFSLDLCEFSPQKSMG